MPTPEEEFRYRASNWFPNEGKLHQALAADPYASAVTELLRDLRLRKERITEAFSKQDIVDALDYKQPASGIGAYAHRNRVSQAFEDAAQAELLGRQHDTLRAARLSAEAEAAEAARSAHGAPPAGDACVPG